LITSSIAVALGCLIFIVTEIYFNLQEMNRNHVVLSESIGLNVRSAIISEDKQYISTALNTFVINPDIEAVYVYNKENKLLGDYFLKNKKSLDSILNNASDFLANPQALSVQYQRSRIIITHMIQSERENIGKIILSVSLSRFYSHAAWVVFVALIVFILINLASILVWKKLINIPFL